MSTHPAIQFSRIALPVAGLFLIVAIIVFGSTSERTVDDSEAASPTLPPLESGAYPLRVVAYYSEWLGSTVISGSLVDGRHVIIERVFTGPDRVCITDSYPDMQSSARRVYRENGDETAVVSDGRLHTPSHLIWVEDEGKCVRAIADYTIRRGVALMPEEESAAFASHLMHDHTQHMLSRCTPVDVRYSYEISARECMLWVRAPKQPAE